MESLLEVMAVSFVILALQDYYCRENAHMKLEQCVLK